MIYKDPFNNFTELVEKAWVEDDGIAWAVIAYYLMESCYLGLFPCTECPFLHCNKQEEGENEKQ